MEIQQEPTRTRTAANPYQRHASRTKNATGRGTVPTHALLRQEMIEGKNTGSSCACQASGLSGCPSPATKAVSSLSICHQVSSKPNRGQ